MDPKATIHVEDGKQELVITRECELPLDFLFRAYAEPDLVREWMGTKVLKLESNTRGSYQFETSATKGKVLFRANGVLHEFKTNQKITRTFEMENTPFGVQREFYEFEQLTADTSKLKMHVLYESAGQRDQALTIGLAQGINMAHNRIQDIAGTLR